MFEYVPSFRSSSGRYGGWRQDGQKLQQAGPQRRLQDEVAAPLAVGFGAVQAARSNGWRGIFFVPWLFLWRWRGGSYAVAIKKGCVDDVRSVAVSYEVNA